MYSSNVVNWLILNVTFVRIDLQSEKPKATIRRFYGGRRKEQLLKALARNKKNLEDPGVVNFSTEKLGMSSEIRRQREKFFWPRGPERI